MHIKLAWVFSSLFWYFDYLFLTLFTLSSIICSLFGYLRLFISILFILQSTVYLYISEFTLGRFWSIPLVLLAHCFSVSLPSIFDRHLFWIFTLACPSLWLNLFHLLVWFISGFYVRYLIIIPTNCLTIIKLLSPLFTSV